MAYTPEDEDGDMWIYETRPDEEITPTRAMLSNNYLMNLMMSHLHLRLP